MKKILPFLFLLLGSICSAAENSGVLEGVVGDTSGAPISGAQLKLRAQDREAASGTTDSAGHFHFAGIPAGEYTLVATADGFKEVVMQLQIGAQPLPLQQVRMKIASVNQELTVSASIDPVSADSNSDGLQVDKDLLKSVPIKEGNALATAALFLDPAAAGAEGPKVVVDGVEGDGLDVPESSIKKVFVNKNPYSAEFSRPGKDRIEVTTRPGSMSHIRKRVLFTLRDSSLDARNAFARVKPSMQRDIVESETDGILPGHKGTFYAGGDYLRDNQYSFVRAIVPAGVISDNVFAPQREYRVLGRITWQFTPLHSASVRYNRTHDSRENQGIGAFDQRDRGFQSLAAVQELRLGEISLFSPAFSNEIRLHFKERSYDAHSLTDAPAILVLGAFNSGGGQISQARQDRSVDLQDVASYMRGSHSLRMGGGVKRRSVEDTDRSNFGGTFTFGSLADYMANRPLLFAINQGNPSIAFAQTEVFSFVQDEIRLKPNLGVLVGMRHQFQSNVAGYSNFAPRAALTYSPGSRGTVFRLGGGIFYDRQPWMMMQQALLFGGGRLRQTVISNPSLDAPLAGEALQLPSLVGIGGGIRTPYLARVSAGVEQKIGRNNYVSVEYAAMRGYHLYRMRNLNAPLPGSGIRPRSDLLNLDQFESSGMSRNQGVTVTFRTGYRGKFEMLSQYTFSHSFDDTAGMMSLPANNYDLRGEWGRSDFDRRHRLNTVAIVQMPKGWKLGLIGSLASGLPYNITTGRDDNGDTMVNDRPLGIGRNTGKGPGLATTDLRLSRRFFMQPKKEVKHQYIEVRFDAFNIMNRLNATNYVGTLTSPLFGRANSALSPRQLQLSAKVSF